MKGAGLRFYGVARKRQEVGMRTVDQNRNGRFAAWGRRNAQCSRRFARRSVTAVNLELGTQNTLFIRGQGGGLSWRRGQPLTKLSDGTWSWSAEASSGKLEFQLLLNDEIWERGRTHILEPGSSLELTPDFEWPEIPRIAPPKSLHEGLVQ